MVVWVIDPVVVDPPVNATPPPVPARLPWMVLLRMVSGPWQKTPPPLPTVLSARLPLTVLPVRFRPLPCT